jgi:hypothetical protein
MSIKPFFKTRALAAAATLTIAGGLSAASTLPAGAATTQCGKECIQIFSAKFGTAAEPNFIETVFRGVAAAGVPTILHRASSTDSAADFIVPLGGPVPVSKLYAAGLVSAAVNSHYGSEPAVQVEYAPYGKPTGLCAALATRAYQNEGLSLQPCRTPGTTVWVIDFADSTASGHTYFPLVNGSTTDFAHPFGMTILGNPGHEAFPEIKVEHLTGNPADVPGNQLWGATSGPAK